MIFAGGAAGPMAGSSGSGGGARAVPEGFHTATPALVVGDAKRAVEFYGRAFGAERINLFETPDGRVVHAQIRIGDSFVFLSDEFGEMNMRSPAATGACSSSLYLYVGDADALFARAVAAGAVPVVPMNDAFWGDRHGVVVDPFGHAWSILTHKRDMTDGEIRAGAAEFYASGGCGGAGEGGQRGP